MPEVDCRNFKCDSNKNGGCSQNKIYLAPTTEVFVDRLTCAQATYTKEKEAKDEHCSV